MAKKLSKNSKSDKSVVHSAPKDRDTHGLGKENEPKGRKKQIGMTLGVLKTRVSDGLAKKKLARDKSPHKSFKRTYREDYQRETNIPGFMQHIFASFRMIVANYKLFLPFLVLMVVVSIILIGMMGESNYTELKEAVERSGGEDAGSVTKAWMMLVSTFSTGGLAGGSKEVTMAFSILIFLTIWLVTIFIIRHKMVGHEIKLRDALYNAMTPLISTLAIFVIVIIECIPLFILIIAYAAAIQTNFLSTPFYALLFLGFALLMLVLSGYLLSSSVIALLAASAPGLYPMVALNAASELMMSRRIKFVLRLIVLLITIIIMWIVVMVPMILFDMFMKQFSWTEGVPFVPICLVTMTCFTEIYTTTYLYQYYRYLLDSNS